MKSKELERVESLVIQRIKVANSKDLPRIATEIFRILIAKGKIQNSGVISRLSEKNVVVKNHTQNKDYSNLWGSFDLVFENDQVINFFFNNAKLQPHPPSCQLELNWDKKTVFEVGLCKNKNQTWELESINGYIEGDWEEHFQRLYEILNVMESQEKENREKRMIQSLRKRFGI